MVPFIATLGMLGVARGVAKWVAGEMTVAAPETRINEQVGWPNCIQGIIIGAIIVIAVALESRARARNQRRPN